MRRPVLAAAAALLTRARPRGRLAPWRVPRPLTREVAGSSSPGGGHAPPAATTAPADDDTIYALATAPGRAAIAIVRISGPACLEVRRPLPAARQALTRVGLRSAVSGPAAAEAAAGGCPDAVRPRVGGGGRRRRTRR